MTPQSADGRAFGRAWRVKPEQRITVELYGVERLRSEALAALADVLANAANDYLEALGAGTAARVTDTEV